MTPQQILAVKEHIDIMDRASKKYCFNANDQQECFAHIMDGFQKDDFSDLRKYKKSKGKIKTFITTCCNNSATDFLRNRKGRTRYPQAISDLGEWAKKLYKLICWKQYSWEDAYEIFMIQKQFEGTFDTFILKIKPVTDIPCKYNKRTLYNDEVEKELHPIPENPLETLLNKLDTQRRLAVAKVIADINQTLPEEDQLLIKLVYGDDISVNKSAKLMGVSASTGHKRLKKILLKFKEALLEQGIGKT